MRRHWAKVGLKVVALVAIAGAAFGLLVMSLWNWLLPSLFGWPAIGFWQAVGLMVLSRILLGGFRGGMGGHAPWRHRMRERWEGMTPEERERFREGLRSRCGHRPASDDSAAPSAQGPAGA
jgi:hypothetical protein